jgi:ferredoxin-type protein NapG
MSDDKPVNRRSFFRQGLFELLKPLAQTARPLAQMAKELERLDARPAAPKPTARPTPPGAAPRGRSKSNPVLRPPGAAPEPQFSSACTLCGECVKVCPVEAIQIDSTGRRGGGLPFIDADQTACVLCDGLRCMTACPTDALLPTPLVQIDMGTARWRPGSCLRHDGEDCTLCIDICPLGSAAIELVDNQIVVKEEGCIGCGLCQNRCPTQPRSIVVIPRA